MTHITICTDCGCCYEESSEEAANAPDRLCSPCWQQAARRRLAANPVPAHARHQERPADPEEAHERRIKRCRSCRAQIIWLTTAAGKNMPVDADTVDPEDQEFIRDKHVTHWATCPDAGKFRRKGRS